MPIVVYAFPFANWCNVHCSNMRCSCFGFPDALVFHFEENNVVHHLDEDFPATRYGLHDSSVWSRIFFVCPVGLRYLKLERHFLQERTGSPVGFVPDGDTRTKCVQPCPEDGSNISIRHPETASPCESVSKTLVTSASLGQVEDEITVGPISVHH